MISKLTVERLVPVALSKKQHFYIYVIGIVAEAKPDPVHTVLRQYADLVELNRQMEGFLHKKHIPVLPAEKKIRKNQGLLVAFLNQYLSLSDILNNSVMQEFLETRNWTTALDARRPSIMFNNKARGLQPEDWVAPPDGEVIEVPLGEQNNLGSLPSHRRSIPAAAAIVPSAGQAARRTRQNGRAWGLWDSTATTRRRAREDSGSLENRCCSSDTQATSARLSILWTTGGTWPRCSSTSQRLGSVWFSTMNTAIRSSSC